VVRLPDDSFVSSSIDAMRDPRSFGLPYQHLSADASQHLRSFGAEPQTIRPGSLGRFRRTLAPTRPGGFWAAHGQRYLLERWDRELRAPVQVIERDVPWFEPYEEYEGSVLEVRPRPFVRAIQEDEDRRIWVVISVAAENWEPMPPAQGADGRAVISDAQMNRLRDTLIEVVDPDAGVVLAAYRVDELLAQNFAGPGIVYFYAEDDVGHPWYRIYRLRLETALQEGNRP
jgi:hypothetical protein